jgi:hypothetical protein
MGPILDIVCSILVMYRARRMRSRMTRKVVFTVPFYHTYGAQPLCLLSVLHRRAIKWAVIPAQPTSSHMISLCSSTPFPTTEKREKNSEADPEKQKGSG